MLSNPFYFSTFSAISELVVTALVLFVIFDNARGNPLRWKLLFGTLTFEVLVNVAYMVNRSLVIVENHPGPPTHWVTWLGAFHGIISLIMLIGLIVLAVLAYRSAKRGSAYFQQRPTLTGVFVALWLISVASGEVLYVAVWQPFRF
ncbi:MAG TPA: hypothetical protein VIL47_07060 [Candidatus Bipolaricaulota bacterium]